MNSPIIGERELRIIEEVSRDKNLTQRKISHRLDLSLGMTNLILKRLVNKGYIKVKGLDKRKVQYILTPKGFAEKAKKSYLYFLKTIYSLQEMKKEIQHLVLVEYEKGKTHFAILGDGELADIVELSLNNLNKSELEYRRISRPEEIKDNNTVILLAESKLKTRMEELGLQVDKSIDVLSTISGS